MQHKLIAFIGAGNMAQAIITGLVKNGYPPDNVIACDRNLSKRENMASLGVQVSDDNCVAVEQAEVLVLAVKPQNIEETCQPLAQIDVSDKLIISLAAGITVSRLQHLLPSARHIIRAMPNTPSLISAGMCGLYATSGLPEPLNVFVTQLFSAIGSACWVEREQDINTVIAAAASSPAYFFLFLESMQNKAIALGIDKESARLLVQQAMLGAAKMSINNPAVELATLRKNVTSKGGTTAAAIALFEQANIDGIISEAMQAAIDRAIEMESLF